MAEEKKHWSEHPLFIEVIVAIVGALVGAIITTITAPSNPMIERYFALDNISVLLDKYLVDMDYVDGSILEVDSLDQQFQMIQDSFAQYDDSVQSAMVNLGKEQDAVNKMNRTSMLTELPHLAREAASEISGHDKSLSDLNDQIDILNGEKAELQAEIDAYEQRKEAELVASCLVIDGELRNNGDSINNAIAVVDGNNYYSESFLNTHILEDQISQDTANNTIVVGNAKPEKVKFSWDIVTNSDGVGVYKPGGGETFTMDTKSYSEGLVLTGTDYFYAYLGGEYSKLSFTYGHVDNTHLYNLELTIYALDENNEEYTVLKTIPLKATLACDDIEIPLGYATKIKIAMSGGGSSWDANHATQYGLTDIYFYS